MNVKQCMCESNTNSTHIMKDSELVTHINEGHSGIVTDQFMLSFSSQEQLIVIIPLHKLIAYAHLEDYALSWPFDLKKEEVKPKEG